MKKIIVSSAMVLVLAFGSVQTVQAGYAGVQTMGAWGSTTMQAPRLKSWNWAPTTWKWNPAPAPRFNWAPMAPVRPISGACITTVNGCTCY